MFIVTAAKQWPSATEWFYQEYILIWVFKLSISVREVHILREWDQHYNLLKVIN